MKFAVFCIIAATLGVVAAVPTSDLAENVDYMPEVQLCPGGGNIMDCMRGCASEHGDAKSMCALKCAENCGGNGAPPTAETLKPAATQPTIPKTKVTPAAAKVAATASDVYSAKSDNAAASGAAAAPTGVSIVDCMNNCSALSGSEKEKCSAKCAEDAVAQQMGGATSAGMMSPSLRRAE